MRYGKKTNDEPKTLGQKNKGNHVARSQALIDVALAYALCSVANHIGCYIGAPATTGGIRIKFYDDEPSMVYINTTDDFEIEMPEQLSELLNKEITWQDLCKMAPWLAEAARELRKRTTRPETAVPLPERPQKPA